MKQLIISVALIGLAACQPPKASSESEKTSSASASAEVTKESLKTTDDKLNYSVGTEIGKNIKRNELNFQEAIFLKGLKDGMAETETPLLDEKEMMEVKREHAKARREAQQKEREAASAKNKEEGEKFLKENAAKEGVKTTESGLQYKVLTEGTGPKPTATDKVSVNYKGSLIDGTEFDSSYTRGKPAEFAVNRVVKGWTEALQLMSVGSKWEVYIPSDLGYGERGAGAKIGPNAVLIFEMELLDIVKPGDKKDGPPPRPGVAPPSKKPAEK